MTHLDELMALLRFQSISAQSSHASDVSECADWLVGKLLGMGFETTRHETSLHPIIVGKGPYVEGKPTVLIYGHYDVQPVDPLNLWESDPFEPEIRDGRIYARGATDNKGQLLAHILGVEELMKQEGGDLPLNVKFIFEGEEEVGSSSLVKFIKEHQEELKCDVVVVSDTGMVAEDVPTFSYGLRGVAHGELKVFGPLADLHSGVFGGAVANPATVLARLLASCHDETGRVAIDGFYDDVQEIASWERGMWANVPGMSREELSELVGVPSLMTEEGYTPAECIYARPTFEINGMGSGYQGEGSKTIIPSFAFAKISCRLVPAQDPDRIMGCVRRHFEKHAPASVRVEFENDHGGAAYIADPHSEMGVAAQQAMEETFGVKPMLLREGGSIPIINSFQTVLGVDAMLLGLCLPDARIHSPNENFKVSLFEKGIEMSQALMRRIAQVKV